MASSFTVSAEGRRVTVRVTPMQPLSAIVAAAAAALSPPVTDLSACVLKVNGKALSPAELGTPVRFANLSAATAKLELVTGRERGLGVAGGVVEKKKSEEATMTGSATTTTAGPSSSSAAVPQAAAAPIPPPAAAVTTREAAAAARGGAGPSSSIAAAPLPPPPPAAAQAAAPAPTTAAAPPPPPPPRPAPVPSAPTSLLPPRAPLPPSPKPIDPAVIIEASVSTHLSAPGGGIAGLGLEERDVAVFSREDLERAAEAARGGVPLDALASPSSTPDSFFDFTPEDYRAVLGSYGRGKRENDAAASAPLKTSLQRAAEAAARAVAAGDVRLRVHFLDRSILQFRLPATAPLGVLREVVSRALERRDDGGGESGGGGGGGVSSSTPSSSPAKLAPWEWEIYTAPPKTVLRPADDASATLFSLGLSPAANVHCGPVSSSSAKATTTATKEAPRLRPELLALRRSGAVPGVAAEEAEREEEAKKAGGGGGSAAAAAAGGSASGAVAAASNDGRGKGKAGMPKWMKMGK